MKTLFQLFTAAVAATCVGPAGAEVLLEVDLGVENQVTITATTNASSATVSGDDGVGVYLEGFFTADPTGLSLIDSVVSDLTTVGDTSGGFASLIFHGTHRGMNLYSWDDQFGGDVDFVAGTQAFTGSATWSLSPSAYLLMQAGNAGGDIHFPAVDDDDLPQTVIGQWRLVPEPGSLAILAAGGLLLARRRRGAA